MSTEILTGGEIDNKYKDIAEELKQEFINHMIPYWQGLTDNGFGGFYGVMNQDLSLDKKADKGGILNSRILWFFSNAYTKFRDESYLRTATHAYEYLKSAFLDKEKGGIYWSVSYDGVAQDSTKHTYCQSFAIYGLASYYEASGDKEALDIAYSLFDIIETKCRDKDGYLEAFDRDFQPASNEKLSENGVIATRTMNTILHVMEAYTELYRVDKNENVADKIKDILVIFRDKIYDPSKERLEVFFDKDYNSIIDLHSFGHDIETAWLIDRTIEVLELQGTQYDLTDMTKVLTNKIYEVAYNGNSVPAESENGVVLETRIWWVQSESMVGFMNGYEKTGREEYYNAVVKIWKYVKRYIIDVRRGSEWYSDVDKDGKPVPGMPITNEWKCPYHNGRMFIELMNRFSKK